MNEIDKRVVQMEFDNKKFEQNVSETIKSLQKLDEALKINSSTEGLEKTGKSAKKLDKELTGVNDTLIDTRDHFSALEVIGVTALVSLTNAAIKAGTKMARTMNKPLSLAISGGIARSQNIENAKFMLKGLGVAWKDIADDINYGVKNTAYGLDAAAKVASQLVASNVSLGENMRNSLRAVSGVAAMTNSTYEEIGAIFTTVAGQGKLMTMQLRQLEARGLNAAASLGKVLNKTEAEIRDMVTDGKIGFQDFANAMDEAFGEHAKEANKTFSGALSNTKAALSRLGEAFASPTFEAFRKTLNAIIPIIDTIAKKLKPVVALYENILGDITDALVQVLGSTDFAEMLDKAAMSMYTWIAAIRAALNVIGIRLPDLTNIVQALGKFFEKMTLSGDKATTVVKMFAVLFQTLKLIHAVVKAIWKIAFPFLNLAVHILGAIFGVSGDFFEILYKVEEKLIRIVDVISTIISSGLTAFISLIINLLSKIDLNYIHKGLQLITNVVVILVSVLFQLAKIIFVIGATVAVGIASSLGGIVNLFDDILGGAGKLSDIIKGVFGKKKKTTLEVDTTGIAEPEVIKAASDSVDELNKKLPTTQKNVNGIQKAVTQTSKSVEKLGKTTKQVSKGTSESVKTVNKQLKGVNEVLKDNSDFWDNVRPDKPDNKKPGESTAEYYSGIGASAIEENEKESKNAFERFFSHFISFLNNGKNLIAKAIDGVVAVIKFGYNKLEELVKGLNWWKVILGAAAIIAGTLIIEVLRLVHNVIGLIGGIFYLGKGYADRGAALKFSAMTGTILAFGAVLGALLLIINYVDSEKMIAGVEMLIRLVTRIGVFAVALTLITSIASIFKGIASAMLSVSRILNVGRGQVLVSPMTKFIATIGSVLMLLFGSIMAFAVMFDGEEGQKRFDQAAKQVRDILIAAGITIGVLMVAMTILSKRWVRWQKTEEETRSIFKRHTKKKSTSPFEAIESALKSMMKMISSFFWTIVGFAVLDKIFGADTVNRAIWQTVGMISLAVGAAVVLAATMGFLSASLRKGGVNNYAYGSNYYSEYGLTGQKVNSGWVQRPEGSYREINIYLKRISGVINSLLNGMRKFFITIAAFAILNKYFSTGEIVTAFGELIAILGIIFTFSWAMAKLKVLSNSGDGSYAEKTSRIETVMKNVTSLITTIALSISALMIVMKLTDSNSTDLMRIAGSIGGLMVVIAFLTGIIPKLAVKVDQFKIHNMESIIGIIIGTTTAIVGLIAVLSIIIYKLKNVENLGSVVITLGKISIIVATFITIVSVIFAKLMKFNSRFNDDAIRKVSLVISAILGATASLIGLVTVMAGLCIVLNTMDVTVDTIGKLAILTAIVSAMAVSIGVIIFRMAKLNTINDSNKTAILRAAEFVAGIVGIIAVLITLVGYLVLVSNTLTANLGAIGKIALLSGVVIGAVAVMASVIYKIAEAFKSGKLDVKSVLKSIWIFVSAAGGLLVLASTLPVIAATAQAIADVDLSNLWQIVTIVLALGSVFALIIAASSQIKDTLAIVSAITAFAVFSAFFIIFSVSIRKLANAAEKVADIDVGKLNSILLNIYTVFLTVILIAAGISAGVVALGGNGILAFSLATVASILMIGLFYTLAEAIHSIAEAAAMASAVNPASLYELINAVINNIIPLINAEAVNGMDMFKAFCANMGSAFGMLANIKATENYIDSINNFINLIQNLFPSIIEMFSNIPSDLADNISKIGQGVSDLATGIIGLTNSNNMNGLGAASTSLEKFFNLFVNLNVTQFDTITNKINEFKDAIKGLAPTLVAVAAALFVASLVFNAAFASMSLGPVAFIAILMLVLSTLKDSDGPLGYIANFCDEVLGAFFRLLDGTADWGDRFELLLVGITAVALKNIGKITKAIAQFRAGEISPSVGGQIALGAGAVVTAGYASAAMGEQIGKWIGGYDEAVARRDAISGESSDALRMLQLVDGDLKKLNNDQLQYALNAFINEYDEGIVQEGDQRDTMIQLIEKISEQLVENGAMEDKPWQILWDEADKIIRSNPEGMAGGKLDPSKYTPDQLQAILEAYESRLANDESLSQADYVMYTNIVDGIQAALDNGNFKIVIPVVDDAVKNVTDKFEEIKDFIDENSELPSSDLITKILDDTTLTTEQIKAIVSILNNRDDVADNVKKETEEIANDRIQNKKNMDEFLALVNRLINNESHTNPGEATAEYYRGLGTSGQNNSTGAATGGGLGQVMDLGFKFMPQMNDWVSQTMNNAGKLMPNLSDFAVNLTSAKESIQKSMSGATKSAGAMEMLSEAWNTFFNWLMENTSVVWEDIVTVITNGEYDLSNFSFDTVKKLLGDLGIEVDGDVTDIFNSITGDASIGGTDAANAYADSFSRTLMPRISNVLDKMFENYGQGLGHFTSGFESFLESKKIDINSIDESRARELGIYNQWLQYTTAHGMELAANEALAWWRARTGPAGYYTSLTQSTTNDGATTTFTTDRVKYDGHEIDLSSWTDEDWANLDVEYWDRYKNYFSGATASDPTGPGGPAADLSKGISSSSGPGTGINDRSRDLGSGSNVTNIDSNNVTYNYVQNNYSPEALSRIDIYRQTNNQLKTVFDALKG